MQSESVYWRLAGLAELLMFFFYGFGLRTQCSWGPQSMQQLFYGRASIGLGHFSNIRLKNFNIVSAKSMDGGL